MRTRISYARCIRRIQTLLLLARNREKFEPSNEPSTVTKLVSDGSRLAGKEMPCHDCYLPSMEVRPRVRRKNVHRKSLAVLRGFVSGDITRLIGRPGKTWFNARYSSLCIYFLFGYFDSPNYLLRFRS